MDLFKLFRVQRKEKIVNGDTISEYFFVELSESALKKITEDTSLGYFRDFQSEVLSEDFFSHKGDLRWNMYLILIVNSYSQFNDTGILQLIENDADFARKYIMTPKDAFHWIDKSWLNTLSDNKNSYIDPIQEWNKVLSEKDLAGCLTETFAQDNVDSFLEGMKFLSNNTTPVSVYSRKEIIYDEVINGITSLKLNNFRNHCFGNLETLNITPVNLFHGSNGAGKTSIMEAIELAFTNEINRCSEFGENILSSNDQLELTCRTDSQKKVVFQPGKPSAFYKKLAQKWYGVPIGRKYSELNGFYHRYNFFDSEAAYRFALNESSQLEKSRFDYTDNLSRLVFGDDVIDAQKNWTRYLEAFNERIKSLSKQQQKALEELKITRERLSQKNQNENINFDELDRHLMTVKLKLSKRKINFNESANDYLLRLSLVLQSIEEQRKLIIEYKSVDTISIKYLEFERNQLKEKMNELINEKKKYDNNISKWEEERATLNKNLYEIETHYLSSSEKYKIIKETQVNWKSIKEILERPDQIDLKKYLDNQEEELTKRTAWIEYIRAKYSILDTLSYEDIHLLSEKEFNDIKASKANRELELSLIKQQLVDMEQIVEGIDSILSRIYSAGEDYIVSHTNSKSCPLCSHSYLSHEALVEAFELAKTFKSNNAEQLEILHKQATSIEKEIKEISLVISGHEKKINNIEILNKAYEEILLSKFYSNDNINITLQEKLAEVLKIIVSKENFTNKLTNIREQLKILNENGITKSLITQSERFTLENPMYAEYKMSIKKQSFEEFLAHEEREILDKLSKKNNEKESLEKQIQNLSEFMENESIHSVESEISKQKDRMNRLRVLIENAKLLFEDFEIDNEEDLLIWSSQVQKAQVYLKLLLKNHEGIKEISQLKSELETKEEILNKFENRIKRCSVAINSLGQLKLSSEYTKGFIEQNTTQIERFFNLLHTPREFENLNIGADGLTLRRKWDGATVKAFQMSSGQRASLALSVMFAIHLAAPRAPKILMMDEPVANMDDLHLMNLLDLLRDLSLSGRQIFFTTANPDVANLFRRKFSFYRENFTHFEFTRSSGEPVRIQPIYYKPDLAPPVTKPIKRKEELNE
ncbi:AAA family ATPase [Paenibacillus odorifer]|uniref:AAA family ATPase n=1 Tax=Paenibacillus odorifer TaxID=189426 RepID=UPI001C4C87B5|nr:hypothetical protein [Paenibacillus odorifer]